MKFFANNADAPRRVGGGLRKIADAPPPPCRNREHDPPMGIVLPDGTYEHECPGCHDKQVFTVTRPYC